MGDFFHFAGRKFPLKDTISTREQYKEYSSKTKGANKFKSKDESVLLVQGEDGFTIVCLAHAAPQVGETWVIASEGMQGKWERRDLVPLMQMTDKSNHHTHSAEERNTVRQYILEIAEKCDLFAVNMTLMQ